MTPTVYRRFMVTIAIVMLVLVAVQVVLLVVGWTGVSGDWLRMAVIGCVLVFAITALIKGTQARKRGGSEAAPPVDNSPTDNA